VNHNWLGSLLAHQAYVAPADRIAPLLAPDLSKATFRSWIERERPEVVVSNLVDPLPLLRELNYRVPGDIGYASIDLSPTAFEVAGIDQLPVRVGAMAADLVIKQVQHNEFGVPKFPVDLRIDGVWRDGGTVRALRPGSRKPARAKLRRG
jgi:hypothetical protein